MHLIEAFSTWLDDNPDFGASDLQSDTARLVRRQNMIDKALRGEEHPDVVLDLLAEDGIDPYIYLDECEANLEQALQNQVIITDLSYYQCPTF
jgi:hypothetical protein